MGKPQDTKEYWENILNKEGLSPISNKEMGKNPLGDGLGNVSPKIDKLEEENKGHGPMCPINLGYSIDETKVDQPNDRPTEEEVFNKLDKI